MANRVSDCSQIDLQSLLIQRGVDDESTLAHLETCPVCQRRLENLAAADPWWQDCKTHLGVPTTSGDLWATASGLELSHDTGSFASDFAGALAPPSHPEMLGRIGRYEVEKLLGRGGMGVVFKAFDTELNRPVAIKVLAPHLAGSGTARQRFGREARAAAAVAHEHVVAIHDVETSKNPPYLVMQYVPGESLQSHVDRYGPLDTCDLVRIAHQTAAGLAAAHAQGLVHRDIKPGNIMLENRLGRVVLTDFGLARAADDASLTHSGIVAGTPHYMAPEQARGEPADARTDLFSLGAVMYFMATGHPPFRAEQAMAVLHRICNGRQRPLYQLDPNIPDELNTVVERLLEKKPNHRFGSAAEVQQALAEILTGIQEPRRSRTPKWFRLLRHHRSRLFIAALGLTGAVVAGGWFYGNRQPVHAETNEAHERETLQPIPTQIAEEETATADSGPAIRKALDQIEARQFPECELSTRLGDVWKDDLRAVLKDTHRLEKSWPAGYDGSSSFNPQ